jgi:DNA-binding response OmpR family regulator
MARGPATIGKRAVNDRSKPIPRSDSVVAVGGKRILLAEDDDAILQLVTDVLTDAGYEVAQARDRSEALERAAVWRPDLILLDKSMPGGGTEFAKEYGKDRTARKAPIVALSAAIDAEKWAASIGAATYIAKPFDIDTLLATIAEQLRV